MVHCTENPISVFPEMELRGLIPNSYIHLSVRDLYIPRICLLIWMQQKRQTDPEKTVYKSFTDTFMQELRNKTLHIILFCKYRGSTVSTQFWEYINRKKTFILDSLAVLQCMELLAFLFSPQNSEMLRKGWGGGERGFCIADSGGTWASLN